MSKVRRGTPVPSQHPTPNTQHPRFPDLHPLFQLEMRRWRGPRVVIHGLGLYALSLALAAGLQGLWAGDTFYNGAGPRQAERWFFSFAVSQAPALAGWAAVAGARGWQRLAGSGLLAHALASPLRPAGMLAAAGGTALWPVVMWLGASSVVWGAISLWWGAPDPGSVLFAHTLLLAQAVAFGLLGPALAAPGALRASVALGLAAGGMAAALAAIFAIGPLLELMTLPERLISAALLVNPAVAMGTALNLDVLRTPWIYTWTAIPEYRFAYPAPVWTLALYGALAALALWSASRRLAGAEGAEG